MHIAVFGGTFDPPHLGHHAVVQEVLRQGLFDEVWYLPVAVHDPLFDKPWMTGADHRLHMLELVVAEHTRAGEHVRIERIELAENLQGFTHRTLRELATRHPEHRFSFIMGSDQLAKLHLWGCDRDEQCFPQALQEFEWYVYPRGGSDDGTLPFIELKVIAGVTPITISSTRIRELTKQGKSIKNLVLPEVFAYIEQHKLYR